MRVWRMCKTKHAATPLDGVGGMHASGCWSEKGTPIVYTSASPSLAALETLVHFDPDLEPALTLIEIDMPGTVSIEECEDPSRLTPRWRETPGPAELRAFGTRWAREGRSVSLRVPSAVLGTPITVESNYLLNPAHPDMRAIQVVGRQPFAFDPRLL